MSGGSVCAQFRQGMAHGTTMQHDPLYQIGFFAKPAERLVKIGDASARSDSRPVIEGHDEGAAGQDVSQATETNGFSVRYGPLTFR